MTLVAVLGCGAKPSDDGIATAKGGPAAAASASASPTAKSDHEQMLQFTRCMRQNGVDLPDPGSSDTDARTRAMKMDRKALEKAFKACQKYAPAKMLDLRNDPDTRKALLNYAKCMRKHGIDMPDPGTNGTMNFDKKLLQSPKYDAANKACGDEIKKTLRGSGAK